VVDGRIGLDEAAVRVRSILGAAASGGADNAAGHGEVHAERIADGENGLAGLEQAGIAEGGAGQAGGVDLDHGQVGVGIGADNLRAVKLALVVEDDIHRGGAVHDVVV